MATRYTVQWMDRAVGVPVRYGTVYRRRGDARRELRARVRTEAAEVRRRYRRAGIVRHDADTYEVRIGGRHGARLWGCWVVTVADPRIPAESYA